MSDAQIVPSRDEPPPTEPVPKVRRTYGRKKDVNDALDGVSSHSVTSYQTRSEPPEKNEAHGEIRKAQSHAFDASNTFGWKEKLALIDQHFDEVETRSIGRSLDRDQENSVNKDSSSTRSPSTEDDSFGLHDETLLSASIPPPSSSQSDPPSSGPNDAPSENAKAKLPRINLPYSASLLPMKRLSVASPNSHPSNYNDDPAEVDLSSGEDVISRERERPNPDDGDKRPKEAMSSTERSKLRNSSTKKSKESTKKIKVD